MAALLPTMTAAAAFRLALEDIGESFRKTGLWASLGWYDFVLSYRQTVLGPFWEVALMSLWVGGLGFIFSGIFGRADANYFAYLSVGLVLWNYMSSILTAGMKAFTRHTGLLLSIRNPLYTYVLRHLVLCLLRFGLHASVAAAVILVIAPPQSIDLVAAGAGMIAILFTSLWVTPLFGLIGTRFHDIHYLMSAAMRFLFFTTPVFWRASDLSSRASLAHFNPFAHFIEVVRAPLIGEAMWPNSWTFVLVFTSVGATMTLALYAFARRRITLWL